MKKCAFVKFIRKYENEKFEYEVIKNTQKTDSFSELRNSLEEFTNIQIVNFENIDEFTSIFISFDVVDVTTLFLNKLEDFIKTFNCKNIFFDFATYDNQEIPESDLDLIESVCKKQCYFITKNLIKNRENHLYFEVLFYHHIRDDREIPRNILAYKKIKESQRFFWPKHKAFYYPGHIRFHKVKFLEFLYQNKFLDDIIWSCTGIDFDLPVFRDFVPIENDAEFNSFEVLKFLPKRSDFNLFSKDVYNSRGGQINLVTYLDSIFEIVPETRFYDVSGAAGSRKTYSSWNNISEKTIKPTMLSHPFILISKPNTISLLEKFGLSYRFDFWNFDYDSIVEHEDRMDSIKSFTKKVMNMSIPELKEFQNDYHHFTKNNYNIMLNDVYIKSVKLINEKI
jgi:hypothetical protein